MAQTVPLNNKGFSLLEAVIATLLLTVMMFWSVQGMLSAYTFASRNHLRDEAIRVAGEELSEARNTPFTSLSPGTTTTTVTRQIRSYEASYTVDEVVTTAIANIAYSVDITVQWSHDGENYQYAVTTIVGNK